MIVRAKFSTLREGNWHEYLVRFGLGGLATVLAGGVAEFFGPLAGGLFLAFPAIFCASATLIEKHERKRKEEKGLKGEERGKDAAALDAAGAGLVGGRGAGGFRCGDVALCGRLRTPVSQSCSGAWFAAVLL